MEEIKEAQKNEHAVQLGRMGGKKGGVARAERLSKEERSTIAKNAAVQRWKAHPISAAGQRPDISDDADIIDVQTLDGEYFSAAPLDGSIEGLPIAEFGSADRPLRIGEDIEIPCYVLSDGRRVLVQKGLQNAIGMSSGGGNDGINRLARLAMRLRAGDDANFPELATKLANPIRFRIASLRGITATAIGYEATVLADLCDAVLAARKVGILQPQQLRFAERCELLMRGFSRIGITALVDEVTGYQDMRARNALADIFEKFLAKELRPWVRTFDADFYKEIFRLKNWAFDPMSVRRPMVLAQITVDLVYQRLAPGVLQELRRKAREYQKENDHKTRTKLHQWLSDAFGHPKLKEHMAVTTAILQISTDWDQFIAALDKVRPKYNVTLELDFYPKSASVRALMEPKK